LKPGVPPIVPTHRSGGHADDGGPDDRWAAARRLLCVRLDGMGDVLMTTPAIRALKAGRADRHITLLTSTAGASITALVPEIDETIVYAPPWMKAPLAGADSSADRAMAERLRQQGFDAAVIFTVYSQSPLPAAFLCHLAEVPLRLAHCRENPYHLLSDWVPETEPANGTRHEVRRQLDLVEQAGFLTSDERLSLRVPAEALHRIDRCLDEMGLDRARPWVVIHPGATAPSRRYAPAAFAEVARGLIEQHGWQVLITGDAGERPLAAEICAAAGAGARSLTGRLTLAELAGLLSLAPILIANNTGPVHMAAALGTPVVDLYALTNPQHTPWAVPNRVLFHDVPCKFCYKSVCPEGHHNCLRLLSPDTVVAAALDLYAETAVRALTLVPPSCSDTLYRTLGERLRRWPSPSSPSAVPRRAPSAALDVPSGGAGPNSGRGTILGEAPRPELQRPIGPRAAITSIQPQADTREVPCPGWEPAPPAGTAVGQAPQGQGEGPSLQPRLGSGNQASPLAQNWVRGGGEGDALHPSRLRRPARPAVERPPDDRVAVVIVTRDRLSSLLTTIEQLRALPRAHQVVVVDNGSTDGTVEAVSRMQPEVTLIALKGNRGGAARTVGAVQVTTPYIAFCDDDSWWAPGALTRAADPLDAHPTLAVLAARVLLGDEQALEPACAVMAASPLPSRRPLPGPAVLGFIACGAVVRRSAYLAVGGFHARFGIGGEEELLAVDLAAAGFDLAYVNGVVAHHYPSPVRNREVRQRTVTRNALWVAWLRRPPRGAVQRTVRLARPALRNRAVRAGLFAALRGLPWVAAQRRSVPRGLETTLRLLDAAEREEAHR